MKLIAPDYYREFRCIADKCRHSCCIGWEIDIDEDTLELYRNLPGETGELLRNGIEETEDGAHFRLGTDERCPMLRQDGLCELICRCGEEALCQICADHPRFRFDYADCTEIGLGLCCEAAAALILKQTKTPELIVIEDDGEEEPTDLEEIVLRSTRDLMTEMLFAPGKLFADCMRDACRHVSAPVDETSLTVWKERLLALERLDPSWTDVLSALDMPEKPADPALDMPLRQLAAYFLYRHMPAALDDGDTASKAAFAQLSCRILAHLAVYRPEGLAELARMYSSEIEYSDENLDILFDWLS